MEKTSPYVIQFSYSLNGEIYHSKSYLLWDKPNLTVGNSIEVYVYSFPKAKNYMKRHTDYTNVISIALLLCNELKDNMRTM